MGEMNVNLQMKNSDSLENIDISILSSDIYTPRKIIETIGKIMLKKDMENYNLFCKSYMNLRCHDSLSYKNKSEGEIIDSLFNINDVTFITRINGIHHEFTLEQGKHYTESKLNQFYKLLKLIDENKRLCEVCELMLVNNKNFDEIMDVITSVDIKVFPNDNTIEESIYDVIIEEIQEKEGIINCFWHDYIDLEEAVDDWLDERYERLSNAKTVLLIKS